MATMKKLSIMPLIAESALRGYLTPKLAQDAKLPLAPLVKDVTRSKWKTQKAALVAAITKATEGKLAQDADIKDLAEMLDTLDPVGEELPDQADLPIAGNKDGGPLDKTKPAVDAPPGAEELHELLRKFLSGKIPDHEIDSLCGMIGGGETESEGEPAADAPNPFEKKPDDKDKEPPVTKGAMDAAIKLAADAAAKKAEEATIARLGAIRDAERDVRPYIGDLAVPQKDAADVYRLALDTLKVDHKGVTELSGLRAILKMAPKPGDPLAPAKGAAPIALDAAKRIDLEKRFPGATSLKIR